MHWIINTTIEDNGPHRVNHSALVFENSIYSFGGYSLKVSKYLREEVPIDVHVLNTITFKWTKRSIPEIKNNQFRETPYFRYGHTTVFYEDEYTSLIYLWGGRADHTKLPDTQLYSYNPRNHYWVRVDCANNAPSGRDGHSSTVVGKSMFVFGGYKFRERLFSNDLHEYNFETFTWTTIDLKTKLKPYWRDFHTATAINDKIYIFGGRMDSQGEKFSNNCSNFYCNRLFEYDTKEFTWNEVLPIMDNYNDLTLTDDLNRTLTDDENNSSNYVPDGRRSHSAVAYGNRIIFFGGYDEVKKIHFNDLFEFDIYNLKWSLLKAHGIYPSKRRRHVCCVYRDRMLLFGGNGEKLNSAASKSESICVNNLMTNLSVNDENHSGYMNAFDKSLETKPDLHVLNLDISTLRDLTIRCILDKGIKYKSSNLPNCLKVDIEIYN